MTDEEARRSKNWYKGDERFAARSSAWSPDGQAAGSQRSVPAAARRPAGSTRVVHRAVRPDGAHVAAAHVRQGARQGPAMDDGGQRTVRRHNYGDRACWTIEYADTLEGHTFEYWCKNLLLRLGYINVEVTKGSSDYGVDLICELDGVRYAVQCKCWKKNPSVKSVQEINTGKDYYNCQVGVVMTNRHLTRNAVTLANGVGVKVWDRDWICEMLSKI